MKKMSSRFKIIHVVGARPQFVKVALVVEAAHGFSGLASVIVHTGQHYDRNMSDVFFKDLSIPKPKYNLGIGSGLQAEQTAQMLEKLESVFLKEKPDMVFVYGDTNSTLAGSLAAAKLNIPLAHVEAGLRSFNRTMPEEINRVITDRIANVLFCPTKTAVVNLKKEGISKGVFRVNDVMIDMLERHAEVAGKRSSILKRLKQRPGAYYLATVHRAANTDDVKRLKQLVKAFNSLDKKVIFPVHPRTRRAIAANRIRVGANVVMSDAVSYIDMLSLELNAAAILTDSGGVQKEAHYFKVPCVTLRDETEWVETVKSGWNTLAGVDGSKIRRALRRYASNATYTNRKIKKVRGSSAKEMLKIALRYLRGK